MCINLSSSSILNAIKFHSKLANSKEPTTFLLTPVKASPIIFLLAFESTFRTLTTGTDQVRNRETNSIIIQVLRIVLRNEVVVMFLIIMISIHLFWDVLFIDRFVGDKVKLL